MTDHESLDDAFSGAYRKRHQQDDPRRPRVLIADDDTDMRDMLSDLMRYEGYEAFPAADGHKALALAAAQPLDLALVDVCMPGPSGMALVNQLKALQPDVKAIVITAYGSLEDGVDAVRSGAFHYLLKPLSVERLRAAIKEALLAQAREGRGEKREEQGAGGDGAGKLSPRQTQVLRLIGQGLTNKEIAAELGLREKTVGNYVSASLRALRVRNRAEAVLQAHELGLL